MSFRPPDCVKTPLWFDKLTMSGLGVVTSSNT
jgi:hypothetical protein